MIHKNDFDNQFFRMVTIALAKTLTRELRWINYYEPKNENDTGRQRVIIPFYISLVGDERFVYDAFLDDIVDKRVFGNTDQYQRGVITLNSVSFLSNEFANPNQYISQKTIINDTLRKIVSKVKAVPVVINYSVEIQLDTMNEVDKCIQRLLNVFFSYMFFSFDYFGIKIDAFFTFPDNPSINIERNINLEVDKKKKISLSLDVKTFYPIFKVNIEDLIVCDNDNLIDWDKLGVPKPSNNFEETIRKYNENIGQICRIDGSDEYTGVNVINNVYWYLNLYGDNELFDSTNENMKPK